MGRFLSPWGIKGWLQVYSFADPREGIFAYSPWFVDGAEVKVEAHKVSGKRLVVKLAGVDTPEDARVWAQKEICIDRSQLPKPAQGEFYWHDLVGCQVINLQDDPLGIIAQVMATGANDVLEIDRGDGAGMLLIPFVKDQYVRKVDLERKVLVVDWPTDWLVD